MEAHNAIILFKRSKSLGFRYMRLVSDGDAKVLPHIEFEYGKQNKVLKEECKNNLNKRMRKRLEN